MLLSIVTDLITLHESQLCQTYCWLTKAKSNSNTPDPVIHLYFVLFCFYELTKCVNTAKESPKRISPMVGWSVPPCITLPPNKKVNIRQLHALIMFICLFYFQGKCFFNSTEPVQSG